MIDLANESTIPLTDAAKLLPRRPSVATLWRWAMKGIRGVRLETCLVGAMRYTSREALQRFSDRLTAADRGEPIPTRTPRQRERAIEAAERELRKAGI
ncbi:MAG: DUF1580 domain-containing protein [Pirellulales bacterium]